MRKRQKDFPWPHTYSAWTATNVADEWDFGTGIPSSRSPRMCISIASCIRSSVLRGSFPLRHSPGDPGNMPNNFFLFFQ